MNSAIRGTFAVFVALFTLLVLFTSWWSIFQAEGLKDKTANRRELLEDQQVPRGLIVASGGERLVVNEKRGSGNTTRFVRRYPLGPLFGHPVGYAFISKGSAGLEKSQNDFLAGRESEFASIFEKLQGAEQEGDDVRTTLDVDGQRAAVEALGGRRGSVVAIEPETGRIRVMVSVPEYDPNQVPQRFEQFNRDPGSPLFNRATQSTYPPGSTFKVVTAVAAIDSGRYTPDSMLSGRNNKPISGVPLQNFGGEEFGTITLTDALTNSVNTVWGEVGETLGKDTMYRYMRRFGFNQEPPLDYPRQQMVPSGVFEEGKILGTGEPVDMGRVAIGQERLQVTPLQMAMVAAAVGNGGELMTPHLVERVVAQDGRVTDRRRPREMSQVMSSRSAEQVGQMMSRVVEEGSGTAAALSGTRVAGKTGTAEVEGGTANQAWFIAFAPVDRPRMAIAATVERTQGTGGEDAAPVAKRVLETLLGGGA